MRVVTEVDHKPLVPLGLEFLVVVRRNLGRPPRIPFHLRPDQLARNHLLVAAHVCAGSLIAATSARLLAGPTMRWSPPCAALLLSEATCILVSQRWPRSPRFPRSSNLTTKTPRHPPAPRAERRRWTMLPLVLSPSPQRQAGDRWGPDDVFVEALAGCAGARSPKRPYHLLKCTCTNARRHAVKFGRSIS